MAQDILLDIGTNEVELLEFMLGEQSFGINVAKIMQIVAYEAARHTAVPSESPALLGVFLWQERTIPLIDLNVALNRKDEASEKPHPIVLVTRFNNVTNGFLINNVNRIHRIDWERIKSAGPVVSTYSSNVTGSVSIEGKEILLVDFEYIVAELFPALKMSCNLKTATGQGGRELAKIVFAEDSKFIRTNVISLLRQVGYQNVSAFENGQDAFLYLQELISRAAREKCPVSELVSLVITDIEMPKMDGLTLCRNIKEESGLAMIPVAIFSSLVDEQMAAKCKEVGADIYTTKPRISELVELVDQMLGLGYGGDGHFAHG